MTIVLCTLILLERSQNDAEILSVQPQHTSEAPGLAPESMQWQDRVTMSLQDGVWRVGIDNHSPKPDRLVPQ